MQSKYSKFMGYARREWFVQFLTRIYKEIPGAVIANFSKLKGLQAPRFAEFRQHFTPKLLSLFLMPANTFDNVSGLFPIGFFVWDTAQRETFTEITADVYDKDGAQLAGKKIVPYKSSGLINDWIDTYRHGTDFSIGTMIGVASDFQNQRLVRIEEPFYKVPASNHHWQITADNLIPSSVYYAVRHVIPATWLNDRDQFLFPNDVWKADKEFQTDCLAYTLFNTNISARCGTNHWIPFTEKEVDAGERFESHFMTGFMAGKVSGSAEKELFDEEKDVSVIASEAKQSSAPSGVLCHSERHNRHSVSLDCFQSYAGGQNRNCTCQAFSMAGHHQGFDDNYKGMCRGTLFRDVARICDAHHSAVIFCENVKGLVTHGKERTFRVIRSTFEALGYTVFYKVLNSKDFGVPQNRERIYIAAFKSELGVDSFDFPAPSNPNTCIRDIMEETPVPAKYYLSDVYLATLRRHKARHAAKGNGFGYEIRSLDGKAGGIVCGGMGRERNLLIDKRQTDLTPTTHIKGVVNTEGVRRMTPHEWARLQGLPDGYKLQEADTHLYKQLANSVTIPVIEAIARKRGCSYIAALKRARRR